MWIGSVKKAAYPQRPSTSADGHVRDVLTAYKLLDMAQQRWRHLSGTHLLPLVWAGVTVIDGMQKKQQNDKDR